MLYTENKDLKIIPLFNCIFFLKRKETKTYEKITFLNPRCQITENRKLDGKLRSCRNCKSTKFQECLLKTIKKTQQKIWKSMVMFEYGRKKYLYFIRPLFGRNDINDLCVSAEF